MPNTTRMDNAEDGDARVDAPGDAASGRADTSAFPAVRTISGAAIRLDNVTKSYGSGAPAVDALSLDIPAGEIVMFVGPSGCGKTTSLKMINRLIEPTSGTILIDGEDARKKNVDDLRRHIGYVIQGGSLFPHLTVAQNIALVPGLLKWEKKRTSERVDELLDLVGLAPGQYRDRFPRELSGGQQQRVGVARGLAADPPVVLMDEPFGAVDPITRQRLQDELLAIQRELGKTIVCVTHDIDEAIKLGDRILILKEHAHIAQYDTPEAILAAPADQYVEDFVGTGSTLKQLSLARVDDLELIRPATAHVGDSVRDVRERAAQSGEKAVVVLDDRNRPVQWVDVSRLGEVIDSPLYEPPASVDRRATLNDALDTMLSSSYGAVLVTGSRGEFRGIVTFDAVTDHIRGADGGASQGGPR
ncbi:MAG: ATP-binding cassette domain-containing protein [Mobilicoccus sp.]|nr:ATP-binding cassette domain-containing protein [Mobilicoccus sp.]